MAKFPTLLEQFRSFCFQNKATDFEEAVKYFAVFGGMGWNVDMTKPLDELIEEKVLNNYRYIHGDIAKITQSNQTHHVDNRHSRYRYREKKYALHHQHSYGKLGHLQHQTG
jgi:hypothetical protein